MKEVTQGTIARELGISRTTVSRCFSNHKGINPRTRARVFEVAARLGYHYQLPRTGEQVDRLEQGGFKLAALVCNEGGSFGRGRYPDAGEAMLQGVSEAAQARGHAIELHFLEPADVHEQLPELAGWRQRSWDGMLLVYPFPAQLVAAANERFALVSLMEQYQGLDIACSDADQGKAMEELVNHLHALGHKRIGFAAHQATLQTPYVHRRYGAWAAALSGLGLTLDPRAVYGLQVSLPDRASRIAAQIREGYTAWVCAADHQAFQLMEELREEGLEAPRDYSITGFDGLPGPSQFPSLTSARPPLIEIGKEAVRLLEERVRHRAMPALHTALTCQLVEGASTGVAPAN